MKFKLIALLVFLAIPLAVSAQKKNKYIGYEYTGVVYNETLPNGVKDLGGNLLTNEDYAVSRMKKGKTEMIWLIKVKNRNDDGVPMWKVKKVLVLPKLQKNQQLLRGFDSPCKAGGKSELDLIVLADYTAKTKAYKTQKAWRVNTGKSSFEEISAAKITCESGK